MARCRRGRPKQQASEGGHRTNGAPQDNNCHYCGIPGHWARECRKKQRDEAHLVQAGDDCNLVQVPTEPRLKLSKESSNPLVDATFYRSIVGSLRYLVHT